MITNLFLQKYAVNITEKKLHLHKPKALSPNRDRSLLKNTAKLLSEAQKWKARCPFPAPQLFPLKIFHLRYTLGSPICLLLSRSNDLFGFYRSGNNPLPTHPPASRRGPPRHRRLASAPTPSARSQKYAKLYNMICFDRRQVARRARTDARGKGRRGGGGGWLLSDLF